MRHRLTCAALIPLAGLFIASCGDGPNLAGPLPTPLMSRGLSDGTPLDVRGFDLARGSRFSIADGDYFTSGRDALLAVNPNISFSGVSQLSAAGLAGADIVVVASSLDNATIITPLSQAEQDALGGFVASGGCAVIFAENGGFEVGNESLIDPFGLDASGLIVGFLDIPVSDPAASPVTDGPFGVVTAVRTNYPGGFDQLGPYATGFAPSELGPVLAVIEPGAVASGSGPVVLYAEVTGFAGPPNPAGRFSENEVLWLNTFDFCLSTADPDERIESMKSDVDDLVSGGTLDHGEGGSLTIKLSVAQKKLGQGNEQAAIGTLNAFINQVLALVNSGRLSEAEGQALVDAAQSVIDQLVSS